MIPRVAGCEPKWCRVEINTTNRNDLYTSFNDNDDVVGRLHLACLLLVIIGGLWLVTTVVDDGDYMQWKTHYWMSSVKGGCTEFLHVEVLISDAGIKSTWEYVVGGFFVN